MRLKSHVKYWSRNAFVWTGISLACVLGFWIMNGLSRAKYVRGIGPASTFLVYLAVVGAFVSMIAVISTFQTEIPRLVSLNVTRKAAVWGLTAGHAETALLHTLLGILIWCIWGIREIEMVVFIASLTISVMLGFGGFGMLLGAAVLRWGKIGTIIMAAVIMVMTMGIATFIALRGESFLQGFSMETMMDLNFWPLAFMAAVFYLFTAAAAAMFTRKIEVRV